MQTIPLYTILLVAFFISTAADLLVAQKITHVPLYTFHGDSADDGFGESVSSAGDVNGDGRADLIVGAAFDDNNGSDSGSVRVFSGSDGSVLYNFNGDQSDNLFGASVSGAGDVNGDGTPDLIVGSPTDANGGNRGFGYARVLSGSDGSVLYNFVGDDRSDRFGVLVSGAGDVNGDGTPDLIVGTQHNFFNDIVRSVRVLSGFDGSVLHDFDGGGSFDRFGLSLSGVGDVNGDGRTDLIVGAQSDSSGGGITGRALVLSGSDGSFLYDFAGDDGGFSFGSSVSDAGDVNGDGTPDLIIGASFDRNNSRGFGGARVLSGSDGSILYTLDGDDSTDRFGFSVSGAGDVNGDGRDDLIVGAIEDNNNGFASGAVHVFSGSDGSALYSFDGDSSFDYFGTSVSGAGDVNGDGIDDFIVGASRGGDNEGGYVRVFVSKISAPELLLGDCNLDGFVNFADIAPFISILSASDFLGQADINEDGVVDFLDISPFVAILSSQ